MACSAHAAVTVMDDTGVSITLAQVPQRIVSLAPGATEMLFAAGAGDRVIATVEYSNDPPQARLKSASSMWCLFGSDGFDIGHPRPPTG